MSSSYKRILLIQAFQGRHDSWGAVFPLGLCYLGTVLTSAGHAVEIFDPNTHEDPYPVLAEKISLFSPDVVGLSIRNIDSLDRRDIFYHYKTVAPTLDIVKKQVPDACIIVGGSGFSMFAQKIMERNPRIDIGVFFEAEEIIVDLVENFDRPETVQGVYYRKDTELIFTGNRSSPDINRLPIPRRNFLDLSLYPSPINNVGIQTKRGCLLNCAYCSYPFLNGRKIRLRDPELVIKEIKYLKDECDVHEFMFVDGVFNRPAEHAREICELIIKENIDIKWSAWCDIKEVTPEFLDLATKAGMRRMPLSPDAGTDAGLRKLGKNIKTSDIDRVLKLIRNYKNLYVSFGFYVIAPGQTFQGLLRTLYYYFKINLMLAGKRGGAASLAWIRIEPHTRVNKTALKEGVIQPETDLLPDKESDIKDLFYSIPSLRFIESGILLMLLAIDKGLKNVVRFLKRKLKK